MNSPPGHPKFLPYGRQCLEEDDIAAVSNALRGDFLTTGPLVEAFEKAFAQATGARHAVVCNSGTASLHLAVLALGLGPGDVAIVPSLTFLATANVVRMTGADVVFADVDPDSGLMTAATFVEAIERAGSRPVKAALPVHLNGALCAMSELKAVGDARGIALVEDACHALGVPGAGDNRHSAIACFSTHPVKAIATGEGGMAVTGDPALAANMKRLRSHGMTNDPLRFRNADLALTDGVPNPWYYEMHEIGWNYRQTDIHCALGLSQLGKLEYNSGGGATRSLGFTTVCWRHSRRWSSRRHVPRATTAGICTSRCLTSKPSASRVRVSWRNCATAR